MFGYTVLQDNLIPKNNHILKKIMNQQGNRVGPSRALIRARRKPLPPVPQPQRQRKRQPRRRPRNSIPGDVQLTGRRGIPGIPDGLRSNGGNHPFANDEILDETVAGSTTTAISSYAINPGQATVFPWLSAVALRYEKYRFTQLEFYYKRRVSEFATNGAAGKVAMNFDYDASDSPPTSFTQMVSTKPKDDAMPCSDMMITVDCRRAFENGPKYVRSGNLPGGSDIKTFDAGRLNFGAFSNAAATTVGELHVRYAGLFEVPVLEATTSAPANFSVAQFTASAQVLASTVAENLLLATEDTNGLTAVNTAGSIVLPAGNYLLLASAQFNAGTSMTSIAMQVTQNAVSVFEDQDAKQIFLAGAAVLSNVPISGQSYVTSNGTDAFVMVVTVTGTGALEATGRLIFIAV